MSAAVTKFCADAYVNPRRGRLLVLSGENGCGKTHTLLSIQRWVQHVGPSRMFVAKEDHVAPMSSRFVRWPEFLSYLKEGNWSAVETLFDVPILLLDEIGGEHDPSKVGTDALVRVLSRRENKWTVLATNISPENWEVALDRRASSRFFRNSTICDMSGVPDYSLV